jgi:hypothetical protein
MATQLIIYDCSFVTSDMINLIRDICFVTPLYISTSIRCLHKFNNIRSIETGATKHKYEPDDIGVLLTNFEASRTTEKVYVIAPYSFLRYDFDNLAYSLFPEVNVWTTKSCYDEYYRDNPLNKNIAYFNISSRAKILRVPSLTWFQKLKRFIGID